MDFLQAAPASRGKTLLLIFDSAGKRYAQATPRKILVVKGNEESGSRLPLLLAGEGFAVSCAAEGQEAYLKDTAEQPELIVTDFNRTKISGLGFIQLIKQEATLVAVPVVAMGAVEKQFLGILRGQAKQQRTLVLFLSGCIGASRDIINEGG